MVEELAVLDGDNGVDVISGQILERDEFLFLVLLFVGDGGDEFGLDHRAVQVALGVGVGDLVDGLAAGAKDNAKVGKLANAVDYRVGTRVNLNYTPFDLIPAAV